MGCINSKDMLEESLCSTPKNAKVPCNVIEEVQGCTSSYGRQYYSPRIYKIMEQAKGNYVSEVESTIESSKDHWTETKPEYGSNLDSLENPHNMENLAKCALEESTSVSDSKKVGGIVEEARNENLELYKENVAFIKSLQMEYPDGDFFTIDGVYDDWMSRSKIIGKGGQATIYASGSRVLKVFNVGYSLVDLRNQWPLTLLHKRNPSHPDFLKSPAFCNSIYNGRLLRDGRFAFEMPRRWGDLRKLLDVRMQQNGNQRPPFMLPDDNYDDSFMYHSMYEIARGMRDIEDEETSCEEVIEGKRPKLPKHLRPWMRELMDKCWHSDPSQRPTFEEIHDLLGEKLYNFFSGEIEMSFS